jgi:hypothetical protein
MAQAFRHLSRSLDSHLVSTAGLEIGITIVDRLRSQGQAEQHEMTDIIRAIWRKGALRRAMGKALGLRKLN